MRNEQLKVGIVGCGNLASLQLKYISKYIVPENIAICDLNQIRVNWLAKQYKIANTFLDLHQMIEVFKPNVVHVLTPPGTHRRVAMDCMSSGCHVFLEKPMCLSVQEAEEITEAAAKLKQMVCVDHLRLFDPQVLKVKNIIEAGVVGEILSVSTTQVTDYLVRKREGLTSDWMHKLPGEVFFDILPHHLSLLNEFLPQLSCKTAVLQEDGDGTPRVLNCLLLSDKGSASVRLAAVGYPENSIVFDCTRGNISIDFNNRTVVIRKIGGLPGAIDRVWGQLRTSKQIGAGAIRFLIKQQDNLAGMDKLIQTFYSAIVAESTPPSTLESGLTTMKITEDMFKKTSKKEAKRSGKNDVLERVEFKSDIPQQKCDTLVTGGYGFIGRKLVRRLLSNGNSVRIFAHRSNTDEGDWSQLPGHWEVFRGNISNPTDVENACKGVRTVYHLAAATKGPWFYHLDATVGGTQNVTNACLKHAIENLIYVSTLGVFNIASYHKVGTIDEDFPYETNPEQRGNYRHSKLLAEKIVLKFMAQAANETKVSIIRPGIVFGPGKNPLQGITRRISRHVSISLEPKHRILPIVYVENLVDALLLASKAGRSGVYNIVDDEAVTVKAFVEGCKQASGQKFMTLYLPAWLLRAIFGLIDKTSPVILGKASFWLYNMKAKGQEHIYTTQRIRNSLGWQPRRSFDLGIGETLIRKS